MVVLFRPLQHRICMSQQVRPIALCLIVHQDRVLLHDFTHYGTRYLRPIGGGIDFGERAIDAVRREVMEELNAAISEPELLAVWENPEKFIEHKDQKHEIIFLFRASLVDMQLSGYSTLPLNDNGVEATASWFYVQELLDAPKGRLEPPMLSNLLAGNSWKAPL